MAKLSVIARVIPENRIFEAKGRDAWALLELHRAGPRGVTPIDNPGPRWSGYILNLKRKHGLAIETVNERHLGQFAGRHGRYVLRSHVEIVSEQAAA